MPIDIITFMVNCVNWQYNLYAVFTNLCLFLKKFFKLGSICMWHYRKDITINHMILKRYEVGQSLNNILLSGKVLQGFVIKLYFMSNVPLVPFTKMYLIRLSKSAHQKQMSKHLLTLMLVVANLANVQLC